MEITYLGHSAFSIKGKNTTVICDPFSSKDNELGLKFPKSKADIVLISHNHHDHNNPDEIEGKPFIVANPGEYEVGGVNIFGFQTYHDAEKGAKRGDNTVYLIEMEGISLCHLGDLGHKLEGAEVEELSGVDVLFVPVGGFTTLDAAGAADVVRTLDPKIVIPMHYMCSELKFNLDPVEKFLKEMGQEGQTQTTKLELTKEAIPEEMKIVLMVAK